MLTAMEMLTAIGKEVSVNFENLSFVCTVLDVKTVYGKVRVQIVPVMGSGTGIQWIELTRIVHVFEPCNIVQNGVMRTMPFTPVNL
jgi:hypothetical protein